MGPYGHRMYIYILEKFCLLFQVVVYYKYVHIYPCRYICKISKKFSCFYNIDLSIVAKNPILNNKHHP